jgi:hypothetical protein
MFEMALSKISIITFVRWNDILWLMIFNFSFWRREQNKIFIFISLVQQQNILV